MKIRNFFLNASLSVIFFKCELICHLEKVIFKVVTLNIDFFSQIFKEFQQWKTDGCTLLDVKDDGMTAVCACTHLTAFSVTLDTFIPELNLNQLTDEDLRNITLENLIKYPAPLMTCLIYIVIAILACQFHRVVNDIPPIARDQLITMYTFFFLNCFFFHKENLQQNL